MAKAKQATVLLSIRIPATFRAAIEQRAESRGQNPSDYVRAVIAADLGREIPELPQGFAAMSEKKRKNAQKNAQIARRKNNSK